MNNIFVGNLSLDATEQSIRTIFEDHGTVERLRIMTDRETGQPRGFAFVEMTNDAAAEKVIRALDGTELNGRVINVSPARLQLHRHSGNGRSRSNGDFTAAAPRDTTKRGQ